MKRINRKADPYMVEAGARILDVLELFRTDADLSLHEVSNRLAMVKSTAFRLLYTLEKKGYVEHTQNRQYRRRKRYRIGYATVDDTTPFIIEVNRGIMAEAQRHGLEVQMVTNELDPTRTVENVEKFVKSGVDLVIEYNPDEHISHVVADRCEQANVPVIAITFPIPGARLFSINNFRAGITGGESLGEHITRLWKGEMDAVLVLDIMGTSPAQKARVTGMLEGLRHRVAVPEEIVEHIHCDRALRTAEAEMSEFLKRNPRMRRIAVLSHNDHNALGAVRALERAGRGDHGLVLAQGGVTEAREELRKLRSPLWAAVAHFPEQFGKKLIPLAMRVLTGEGAPASVTVDHALLTRSSLAQYYPSV